VVYFPFMSLQLVVGLKLDWEVAEMALEVAEVALEVALFEELQVELGGWNCWASA
jgi:hypothetical protein